MADTLTIKLEGLPQLRSALKNATGDLLGAVHRANVATAVDLDRETKQNLTKLIYTRTTDKKYKLTGRLRASYHFEVGDNKAHGVRWKKPYYDAPENYQYSDNTGRSFDGSLNVEIPAGGAAVGSNVEYAPFVELGTSKMNGRPALQMAVDSVKDRHVRRLAQIVKSEVE